LVYNGIEMPRFPALILCMTAAAAWSACSLIVTANPEGDGGPADGGPDEVVQEPAGDEAAADEVERLDPQPEDAGGDDPSMEDATDVTEEEPPPPPGWTECLDGEGGSVWVRLMPASADHDTWSVAQQDCLEAIGVQAYFDFQKASHSTIEGLAWITDESVFGCLEGVVRSNHDACLNPDTATDTCYYHIGLMQETTGAEPDGGWHWTGYRDGSGSLENLGGLETDHVPQVVDDFNDTSCVTELIDSDCGVLKARRLSDSWSYWFIDFKCVDGCVPYQGLCMISFGAAH